MAKEAFDIYQTDAGYAAVTNAVQRQILDALRVAERQLPELVELTGRSKPTLSSLHMKELLARELIEERGHPTDSRRKLYRLRASKIGSSDIPVAQLREAVQHYVSLSPVKSRLPLHAAVEAIAHAPAKADAGTLWAQARHLGESVASGLKVGSERDLWMRVCSFLEQEEIARSLRIDLEASAVELAPGTAFAGTAPQHAAAILGGLVEGMAAGKGLAQQRVHANLEGTTVRLQAKTATNGRAA